MGKLALMVIFLVIMTVNCFSMSAKGRVTGQNENMIYIDNVQYRISPYWYFADNPVYIDKGIETEVEYRIINSYNQIERIKTESREYIFIDSEKNFLWHRQGGMKRGGNSHMMRGR